MNFYQKQYSSYHLLPNNEKELVTILPRKILKTDFLVETFDSRNEVPLIGYLTNLLLNKKNHKDISGESITLKRSNLRNFIRKKCHSDKKQVLDGIISEFLLKLKKLENKIFNVFFHSEDSLEVSFDVKYLKSLLKNTVSLNILELTKTRGIRAKKIFLKILAFDMRDVKERFFTLTFISKYLGLDCFNKRKITIRSIKRALTSLSKRLLIKDLSYIGINENESNQNYRFVYKLSSLRQITN